MYFTAAAVLYYASQKTKLRDFHQMVIVVCSGHQRQNVRTSFMLMLVKLSLPSMARRSCHLCILRSV